MREMPGRLDGKVAIISGGARGQGAAIGQLFAEQGAKVVLGDIRDELGSKHAADLRQKGFDVAYSHLDVAISEDWERIVALAESQFGYLNVLVNNAGVVSTADAVLETRENWDRVIAVNQTGVFLGMKHAVPALRRAGGGSIINTSSILGFVAVDGWIAYTATKGAVKLMSKSAALSYARDNIRVNSVAPGQILTPMVLEDSDEEANAAFAAATALGRGGQPREVAWGVLFLASDESSYVTGSELVIDGGFLAH
jgi:NAD(P)-dependent dehydrogenase (short-subunit alcohol dehydrogenase family)